MEAEADFLEGFINLARSASGPQLIPVINNALRHSNLFVFGELLEIKSIQELEGMPDCKPMLDLLKLFAYGTYTDYKGQKSALRLRDLNSAELLKLKQLTIVSRAAQTKEIPYSSLIEELDLSNIRELEDIIIDCIYLGLINGSLDQKRGALLVKSAIGRDIDIKTDIDQMLQKLEAWLSSSESVVSTLKAGISEATRLEHSAKEEEHKLEEQRKSAIEAIRIQKSDEQEMGKRTRGKGQAGGGVFRRQQ